MKSLTEFDEYKIKDKPHEFGSGFHKVYKFPNGFGASIVRFRLPYGSYGSYTSDETEVELAVIEFGSDDDWTLTYKTKITNDVIGHLKEKELIKTLNNIFKLAKKK